MDEIEKRWWKVMSSSQLFDRNSNPVVLSYLSWIIDLKG